MVARTGVALSDDTLAELVERTEGWPAALYLAALSLADRPDPDDFVHRFSGSNRFIGDYLTEEVLSRHPERLRDFILDVSVLDRFSAALCDHLLGRSDSATILNDLERANLFLVPLDGDRTWFRFHQLFAAVARSELELSRPQRIEELHARAAEWYSAHGLVPEAISHWLAAGRARGRIRARPGQLVAVRGRRSGRHRRGVARRPGSRRRRSAGPRDGRLDGRPGR